MLIKLGVRKKNIWLYDINGVVYEGRREEKDSHKSDFSQDTKLRDLNEIIANADLFLGLSAKGVLTTQMVEKMASSPIIFALANPDPEILPTEVLSVRPDAIIATGRSDFPNQVNNVLCFPFIFRGALDVGASEINDEMKIACVNGIAQLARATSSAEAAEAYRGEKMSFGRDYLIPKPFDPRLMGVIASTVAKAAIESGVATRPIEDFASYRESLDISIA